MQSKLSSRFVSSLQSDAMISRAENHDYIFSSFLLLFFFPELMKVKVKSLSHVQLFATPRTVAYQDPPSMGFSRHGYWSGLTFLSPGDLPNPGIKPRSPALQTDALPSEPPGKPYLIFFSIAFHCMDITYFSYSLIHRWVFGFFPVWGCYK